MSEQIGAVPTARGELTVTAFWGGAERAKGWCSLRELGYFYS